MPKIRPSTDIRNKYNEISSFCHDYGEPIYITKNGKGDLVVMSIEAYELLSGRAELVSKLNEGIEAADKGDLYSAKEVFDAAKEGL
ncbi:type II toxin-antitoxin system Phd/YefM family antitoxin [Aminicella lysinilytica]|uniref:Antitoxin n=2 Tax=Aminicella lysinilytica TaxID=433323 RepID=A0A4R6Q8K8_9FIRM|nr:type II toxin-antitoxin system prevent-host-death family antitoxin [Aminicella lysinilytica]TDP58465.1 prevent-host-death family protein [Aminicella lysinilytica]